MRYHNITKADMLNGEGLRVVLIAQREVDKNLDDILNCIDVLLEGRFVMKLHDDRLHYVGSSNQRIIDVKKSIEEGKVVLYIDNSNIGDSDKATVVQCAVNS